MSEHIFQSMIKGWSCSLSQQAERGYYFNRAADSGNNVTTDLKPCQSGSEFHGSSRWTRRHILHLDFPEWMWWLLWSSGGCHIFPGLNRSSHVQPPHPSPPPTSLSPLLSHPTCSSASEHLTVKSHKATCHQVACDVMWEQIVPLALLSSGGSGRQIFLP